MSRAFADITFTKSVKAAQSFYGSREDNRGFEMIEEKRDYLLDKDVEFIQGRDSFYQATISENGWPYVQHRGGSAGFLRVINTKTIAYADFSGNAQYLSVGNLFSSDRISLILMDYANRRRLKIWGRAKIVHELDNPKLIAALEDPAYRARIERAVVIQVEAVEWNCPQHITPRFTKKEVQGFVLKYQTELEELRAKLKQTQAQAQVENPKEIGTGPLELVVSGVRQLSSRVRAYELRRPSGEDLPVVSAGAHLRVPVMLEDSKFETRQYSISSNPARRDIYEIAVQLDAGGTGGSKAVHRLYDVGTRLNCDLPLNHFALKEGEHPVVLIAGGIGITPIKAMAQTLSAKQRSFVLHYAGKRYNDMAYRDRLQREFGAAMHVYASDRGEHMRVTDMLSKASIDTMFYVCGPNRLVEAVLEVAKQLDISSERIRFERFSTQGIEEGEAFRLELKKSRQVIQVKKDQSILQAVRAIGIAVAAECERGNCGTCTTRVLGGEAVHKDGVLSTQERQHSMCICVSRAAGAELVLDL